MLLPREWIEKSNAIPHFTKVIKNVQHSEGIEITMNCNTQAFEWIVEVTKIKHNQLDTHLNEEQITQMLNNKFNEVANSNCLNKMVTSYFLEVTWIYTRIFTEIMLKEFSDIINQCKISLNSLNDTILYHFATLVEDQ